MFKKIPSNIFFIVLFLLLIVVTIFALTNGAVKFSLHDIKSYIGFGNSDDTNEVYKNIFLQIRLPRVLLCIIVGAVLSVSGFLMQTLFRNPIVEPGIIGTSAGAALGAALVFVVGKMDFFNHLTYLSNFLLPVTAFTGGLVFTFFVSWFSSSYGKVNVISMILAGMAVNALASGGTGFLSYIARDPQARSITFWNLGTFSGADWNSVIIVFSVSVPCILYILFNSKQLNALRLGETEVYYLGVNTERLKLTMIIINTLMVSIATAMVGVISFLGLIVPHILRLLKNSDSKYLTISSGLLGATLILLADLFARTIVAPAEIPIGIITAFVGAPLFLILLKRMRKKINPGGKNA